MVQSLASSQGLICASVSPQTEQVLNLIGTMAAMQSKQTGKREMLVSGAPQRRQSDGKKVANAPLATVVAPANIVRSSGLVAKWPKRTVAALWGGETGVRVMSPILLKTSLPRPAPGQAPAGRIVISIAGSCWPINY